MRAIFCSAKILHKNSVARARPQPRGFRGTPTLTTLLPEPECIVEMDKKLQLSHGFRVCWQRVCCAFVGRSKALRLLVWWIQTIVRQALLFSRRPIAGDGVPLWKASSHPRALPAWYSETVYASGKFEACCLPLDTCC